MQKEIKKLQESTNHSSLFFQSINQEIKLKIGLFFSVFIKIEIFFQIQNILNNYHNNFWLKICDGYENN
jgi:hypothetical protein